MCDVLFVCLAFRAAGIGQMDVCFLACFPHQPRLVDISVVAGSTREEYTALSISELHQQPGSVCF